MHNDDDSGKESDGGEVPLMDEAKSSSVSGHGEHRPLKNQGAFTHFGCDLATGEPLFEVAGLGETHSHN